MSEWNELVGGVDFGEGPRWHDGAFWYSDFYQQSVYRVTESGERTAMVVLDHIHPNTPIVASAKAADVECSRAGVEAGRAYTARQLQVPQVTSGVTTTAVRAETAVTTTTTAAHASSLCAQSGVCCSYQEKSPRRPSTSLTVFAKLGAMCAKNTW